jgi:hypothetical protein
MRRESGGREEGGSGEGAKCRDSEESHEAVPSSVQAGGCRDDATRVRAGILANGEECVTARHRGAALDALCGIIQPQ